MSENTPRSTRSGRHLLASTLLSTTMLAGMTTAANAAEIVSGATDTFANAGMNGCGLLGTGFLIRGEFDDTGQRQDTIQRVLADANGDILVRSVNEQIEVGATQGRSNGSTLPLGTYALPISVGYLDIGNASPTPARAIGLTTVPNSVLVAAGGVCEQIITGMAPNQDPVADAGPDQMGVTEDGVFAFLDAQGSSDPDGDTLSYEWRQTGGPAVPVEVVADTNGRRIRVGDPATSNQDQAVTFTLTVRDGEGGVSTDTVTIRYAANNGTGPNDDPVADAGADQTGTGGSLVQTVLDGSNSSDPDNDTLTYTWVQTGGPNVTFQPVRGTGGSRIQVNPPPASTQQQIVTFQLTVDDGNGGTDTDTVSITYAPDQAPIAVAGPDQTVQLDPVAGSATTQLDFTGSSDPEGGRLRYAARQVSGPAVTIIGMPSFGGPTDFSRPEITTPDTPGIVVIEVTVTDDLGQSDTDTVSINFTAAPNRAPTVDAGADQTRQADFSGDGNTQTVTLRATATDPDGDVVGFNWTQLSGPPTQVVPVQVDAGRDKILVAGAITYTQPDTPGTVVYEVTVDDGNGGTATDRVSVVWESNEAPTSTAPATQPAVAAVPGTSQPIDLGTIADPNGQTVAVTVRQVSGPTVVITGANTTTPSFTVPEEGGTVVFEVILSDGVNETRREINVPLSINQTPVAVAGADQTFVDVAPGTRVTLDGTDSSDPDGTALTYSWRQVSGSPVTLDGANTATPSFTYPGDNEGIIVPVRPIDDTPTFRESFAEGSKGGRTLKGQPVEMLTFELTVSDGVLEATDRTTVTINTNVAPTADAGEDRSVFGLGNGDTVALDGTGSSDPDGDALTYAWSIVSGSATLDDAASPTPSVVYSGDGTDQEDETVVVQLIVNDGSVDSAADTISLVFSDNMTPTADAGEDRTVVGLDENDTVVLDGSGSSDPEDDPLTYAWSVISGNARFDDATGVAPTLVFTGDGGNMEDESVEVQLIVSDGNSASAPDTQTITFQDNQAPTANAGMDIGPVDAGGTVTLNGSASTDPENDDLAYAWTQVSGTPVELSDATAQSPTFTVPDVDEAEELVFQLIVNDGREASEPDRVSVQVRPTGSVRIVTRVTGPDGAFSYTSDIAALNATLVTVDGTGSLDADGVVTGTYTVTAADARDAGFALTSLVCDDSDSTTDLANRTATIVLAPGEDVVCTFESVNSREAAREAIREALTLRSQMILAAEPDMQRRVDRLKGNATTGTGASVAGLRLPGSDQFGLSATINERQQSFSGSLLSANAGGVLGGALNGVTGGGKFDVWGEAQFSSFDFGQKDGDFSIYYLGADYLVSDSVLVGGLVQIDNFDLSSASQLGDVDGDGLMAGPYVTARLSDALYIDARAAWGSSDNAVNLLGTFSDEFDTSRALYAATLTGEIQTNSRWMIRPELSVKHLSETSDSYTDSLGVDIPEINVDLGELSFGPRFSRAYDYNNGWTFTPFVEATGIYNFGGVADDILGSETRIRLEGGGTFLSLNGVRLGLSAFTDGLAGGELDSRGMRVSLSYTMK